MKISLAHSSSDKLISVRAATGKGISELMHEAMELLQAKYNQEVLKHRIEALSKETEEGK